GYRFDPESGLYVAGNGTRYYSPQLGRFTQFDPSGYVDGMNLYEFLGGNPNAYLDPSGGQSQPSSTWYEELWWYTKYSFTRPLETAAVHAPNLGYSLKGSGSITANTFTFGLADWAGWTDSERYQGWEFLGTRIASVVSREALIAAATLGVGNFVRAGVQTTTLGVYQLARGTHVGLVTYEYGSAAYDVYSGIEAVRAGNPWGWLQIAGGGIGLAPGLRGTLDQIGAGSAGLRKLTRGEISVVAENIARRRLASKLDDLGPIKYRTDWGIDLAGVRRRNLPRFIEVKGTGGREFAGRTALSEAQEDIKSFVPRRLGTAIGHYPRWRSITPETFARASKFNQMLARTGPAKGYFVEVSNLNRFFYGWRLRRW
ncbi:MAG: RHS repeat-associated core domain-containing protein, partial [Phycisphaeraceae bacterium]|nr:RHS repeat-associated core domain-containing protein [Phycisphaeraceae bacterium]